MRLFPPRLIRDPMIFVVWPCFWSDGRIFTTWCHWEGRKGLSAPGSRGGGWREAPIPPGLGTVAGHWIAAVILTKGQCNGSILRLHLTWGQGTGLIFVLHRTWRSGYRLILRLHFTQRAGYQINTQTPLHLEVRVTDQYSDSTSSGGQGNRSILIHLMRRAG